MRLIAASWQLLRASGNAMQILVQFNKRSYFLLLVVT